METLEIEKWINVISAKLFNSGCYSENYTTKLAILKLSNCVGWHFLTDILIDYEDIVKSKLSSKINYYE